MKSLALILVFWTGLLTAQESEISITAQGISSSIVPVEGKSSAQIYDIAKYALISMFDSPTKVIKVDEPAKILRFSGSKKFKGTISTEGIYNYTCELEFKDGRYKISFYDVFLDKGIKRTYADLFNSEGELRKMDFYKKLYANFSTMINEVNVSLKEKISGSSSADKW
ncbi:MAG: DUF4468 domain-containing protein [Flavobacterium sp.]